MVLPGYDLYSAGMEGFAWTAVWDVLATARENEMGGMCIFLRCCSCPDGEEMVREVALGRACDGTVYAEGSAGSRELEEKYALPNMCML